MRNLTSIIILSWRLFGYLANVRLENTKHGQGAGHVNQIVRNALEDFLHAILAINAEQGLYEKMVIAVRALQEHSVPIRLNAAAKTVFAAHRQALAKFVLMVLPQTTGSVNVLVFFKMEYAIRVHQITFIQVTKYVKGATLSHHIATVAITLLVSVRLVNHHTLFRVMEVVVAQLD